MSRQTHIKQATPGAGKDAGQGISKGRAFRKRQWMNRPSVAELEAIERRRLEDEKEAEEQRCIKLVGHIDFATAVGCERLGVVHHNCDLDIIRGIELLAVYYDWRVIHTGRRTMVYKHLRRAA